MSAETQAPVAEPIFDPEKIGASIDAVNKLVMPITKPILRGVQYGETLSLVRGQGMEKDGVRDYIPGDDPRHIDWNLTARHPQGTFQIRERYRDITPSLWVVSDSLKAQNEVNPGYFSKQQLALSIGTAMILLAQKEGMPRTFVGVNEHEEIITGKTPTSGRKSVMHIGKQMMNLANNASMDVIEQDRKSLSGAISRVAKVATESLVVVVSDFRDALTADDAENGWKKPMQQLRHNGNDIIAIQLISPWDSEMPDDIRKLKTTSGTHFVTKKIRARFAELEREQQATTEATLKGVGAAHIKIKADEAKWLTSLHRQLRKAGKRKHF